MSKKTIEVPISYIRRLREYVDDLSRAKNDHEINQARIRLDGFLEGLESTIDIE